MNSYSCQYTPKHSCRAVLVFRILGKTNYCHLIKRLFFIDISVSTLWLATRGTGLKTTNKNCYDLWVDCKDCQFMKFKKRLILRTWNVEQMIYKGCVCACAWQATTEEDGWTDGQRAGSSQWWNKAREVSHNMFWQSHLLPINYIQQQTHKLPSSV